MKTRKKFTGCNRPIRRRVTKHYDWFALVNKYFRGKIMPTSLTLTEVWSISDRIIRQKYYCITVHYHTVCTSENRLGQTVQTGQQALALMKKILCRSVATRLQQFCGKGILCQRTVQIFAASGKVMANNFATSGKLP